MNQRERLLAILVGVSVVCVVLFYGFKAASGALTFRDDRIVQLEQQRQEQETIESAGMRAAATLRSLQDKSLPSDRLVASRAYREWLLSLLRECDIDTPIVTAKPTRAQGDVYRTLTFTATGKGSLKQVTKLLYEFHSLDYLHRIRSLRLTKQPDKELLDISLMIDGVALKGATMTDKMVERRSNLLDLASLKDYEEVILTRDFFSPGNNPPKFDKIAESEIHRGKRESIRVKADPGDPRDRVKYTLVSHTLPGDPPEVSESGTIRLQVEENGKYEVVLLATDSHGKTDQGTVPISVVDPPPPPPVVDRRPTFNEAKFAYITSLLEINGKPQLWLSVRTSGEMLKLSEGDKFEIGDLEGVVSRIDFDMREVELEWGGATHRVRRGQNLSEAQAVED